MEKTIKTICTETILAATALVKQRFIGFTGNYCAAGAKALGVSQVNVDSGEQLPVDLAGILIVESGGVINAGAPVKSDSTGRAVAAVTFSIASSLAAGAVAVKSDAENPTVTSTPTGSVLAENINGYAMDAAGGAGEFIRIARGI